jgi:hypothetical protein
MALTNWTNITQPADFLAAANTSTGGLFWTSIYITFLIILFLSLIVFGIEIAVLVTFFIGMVVGIFFIYLNLIYSWVLGAVIGCLIFFIIYFMWSSNKNN